MHSSQINKTTSDNEKETPYLGAGKVSHESLKDQGKGDDSQDYDDDDYENDEFGNSDDQIADENEEKGDSNDK